MSGKWSGGKGDTPRRIVDTDAYSKNWERIFNNPTKPPEKPKEKK